MQAVRWRLAVPPHLPTCRNCGTGLQIESRLGKHITPTPLAGIIDYVSIFSRAIQQTAQPRHVHARRGIRGLASGVKISDRIQNAEYDMRTTT